MKKIVITFFVFLPIFINAQSFWNVVNDGTNHNISHLTDKALLQDSIILVAGFVSDISCSYHNLIAYHKNGVKLWNKSSICDVIKTDSNFIYTAGYDIGTDDVYGDERIVIAKYNKLGEEIFKIKYPKEEFNNYYFEFEPKNFDLVKDGTILVSSQKSIVKSNINGAEIIVYNLDLVSQINAIHAISPFSYLIDTQNKIYKTDNSLTLMDSIEFSNSIKKLIVKNDTIFTLFNSYLVRMDTSLKIVDTIVTSSVDLKNMEIYENNLWIYTYTDSIKLINFQNYGKLDTLVFPIFMNNPEFIITNNNYIFVGNSFTNQIGLCNFNIENSVVEAITLPDIELIDFEIDSIIIHYYNFLLDTLPRGYSFNTKITVKNNSAFTLNSFAVFSVLHGGMNCVQNFFYQKISGVEILPGQIQTISLNRAYEEGIYNNQLCFKCLAPNSEFEVNTSNNSLCKTFTITGIDNETETKFIIYPNPAYKEINIQFKYPEEGEISILDWKGQLIDLIKIQKREKLQYDVSQLPKGMYILLLKNKDQISAEKFIVTE